MAPPGRRRPPFLAILLSFLFLFSSTTAAVSAVVGIDLGASYIKAALVKPGIPLEIVLSKDSKRKEVSAVAFKPSRSGLYSGDDFPERLYGSDASVLAPRFPGDVYPNLKPLLGLPADGNADGGVIKEYMERHPALQLEKLDNRGTVGFKSGSFAPEEKSWSVEELLAMELKNVKENAELLAGKGSKITDAVITVPAFYTADERRAVELAADLAGLKVLSLISDGLAVGLNYATTRTFPSISEGGKPEYHMVFDMGAGSTTATILRFQGKTVKDVGRFNKTVQEVTVLGTGWDRTLGGDYLNGLVLDHMVEQFVETPGAQSASITNDGVKNNGRTAAKLWKEAERVRHVLSANQETTASFESLHADVDFRYKITRNTFEELASDFASRVDGPAKRALEAANMTFAEIDSIILHGGAVRTPFVQKHLEALVGDASKLRSNVNADEAAVFGAAFKGASLSPSFRVKEIRDTDTAGYGVGIKYLWNMKERNQRLFTPTSHVGNAKQVPFKMMGEFEFTLYQQLPLQEDEVTHGEMPVLSVRTGNLTRVVTEMIDKHGCDREDINTHFSIRIDPASGIPEVLKGVVSCEALEQEKKGGVVDGVKGLFGFGKKEQEPLKDDNSSTESSLPETAESVSSVASSSADTSLSDRPSSSLPTENPKAAETANTESKKRLVTSGITFHVTLEGIEKVPKPELKRMKERLAAFDKSDRARRTREEDLNTLEAYTYSVRDIISDESFIAVSTDEARATIEELVSKTSDWLYGDGRDAPGQAFKDKLKDLKALIDPIKRRKEEAAKRPEQVELLQRALENSEKMIETIIEQVRAAEEAASSAAEEASKSAISSESAASASSITSESAATDSADPLDDLEEPDSSPSESTSTEATMPTLPPPPPYTSEDVNSLKSVFDSVKEWLATKLAEQEKLKPHEDPVLLSSELEGQSRKLNKAVLDVITKAAKNQETPKRPKTAKPKATKTKTKKRKETEAPPDTSKVEVEGEDGKPVTIELGKDGEIPSKEEILEKVRERERQIKQGEKKKREDKKHDEL